MMSQPVNTKRTLGVTFSADQQAHICVWIPQASEVSLAINDHALVLPLTKGESCYWQLTTSQLQPGDTYTFVLDQEKEWADPASLLQPQGVFGPSQAFDTNYVYWEDSSWVNPPIDEYIVYEIDIRFFTEEGTLKAIINKLSHIRKLGVNAILIRPVTDFTDSPGQDALFLFAVQASYGGPGQLQQLINACHFEGLAVVLDLSYKQASQPGYALSKAAGFTIRKQPVGRPKIRPSSETFSEEYRHYLVENALMWFRDFHVDALRLEPVYTGHDTDQLLHQIREQTNALTGRTGRQHYLLVEQDLTLVSNEAKKTGYIPKPRVRAETNNNTYPMAFTQNLAKTKQYRKDCLCDSTFSDILQELFDREVDTALNEPFVPGLQTYPQPADVPDQPLDSEFIKLVAGSIIVSPCIPTLFMGEEWGVSNPFSRLVQPDLMLAGADPELSILSAHGQPSSSVLPWDMLDERPSRTLYHYYQALTALRRQQPALNHLNPRQAQVFYQDGDPTLLLLRSYKSSEVLCLMNFSREKQTVTLPDLGKNWQKLLDSADPIWDGPGASQASLPDASTVRLQPTSLVVYSANP